MYTDSITLEGSLAHDHVVHSFMEPSDLQSADPSQTADTSHWWGNGGQMAPEIGLLSHNIVIQGTVFKIPCYPFLVE